jgi:hypothetical protein
MGLYPCSGGGDYHRLLLARVQRPSITIGCREPAAACRGRGFAYCRATASARGGRRSPAQDANIHRLVDTYVDTYVDRDARAEDQIRDLSRLIFDPAVLAVSCDPGVTGSALRVVRSGCASCLGFSHRLIAMALDSGGGWCTALISINESVSGSLGPGDKSHKLQAPECSLQRAIL